MKLRRLLLLCAVLALGGCQTANLREDFEVSLVNLRFGEATLWETAANFTVRVQNASPEPVVLEGAAHRIYLNGSYAGEGLSNETLEVPRLGSATEEVTVHLRNLAMATKIKSIVENQAVDYRVKSRLYVRQGNSRRTLTVEREGRLDLRDFTPDAQPRPGGAR